MDKKSRIQARLEVSKGVKDGKAGIDRAYEDEKCKGRVNGFTVMTKGFVKDMRAWEIDDTTLDQIAAAGNTFKKMGLKSRFGHPNMSSSALGTFLGRAKNFRKDGEVVRADLYLDKTAYKTPDGDLATYVLDLAENDPEAFGTSVVLGEYELEVRLNKDNTRMKDAEGNELPPMLRVQSLMAVDVVDDPAANNGMFNKLFNESVELSAKATEFLDQLLSNPDAIDRVMAFLDRYRANRDNIDGKTPSDEGSRGQFTGKPKEDVMEFKDITKEQLQKERPELVAALQKEAVDGERSRCLNIVKHANKEFRGKGVEDIAEKALESGSSFDAARADMGAKVLTDLQAGGNKSPGADADTATPEPDHLTRAKKYQSEHGGASKCSMTDALLATADSRK